MIPNSLVAIDQLMIFSLA